MGTAPYPSHETSLPGTTAPVCAPFPLLPLTVLCTLEQLPYCPEFFRKEFNSAIADMKNSVGDRSNSGSSCAGTFISSHMGSFLETGKWCHIGEYREPGPLCPPLNTAPRTAPPLPPPPCPHIHAHPTTVLPGAVDRCHCVPCCIVYPVPDMAYPVHEGERATGYGVALLTDLCSRL